jgi:hypothetical protein
MLSANEPIALALVELTYAEISVVATSPSGNTDSEIFTIAF